MDNQNNLENQTPNTEPTVTPVTETPVEPQVVQAVEPTVTSTIDPSVIPQSQPVVSSSSKIPPFIFVILIIVAALCGAGIWFFNSGNKQSNNTNNSSANTNTNETTTTTTKTVITKPCNIEREHIHLNDLSKDELKQLNIQYTLGMVRTYTNSDIKSIIFAGKEYDYKEVLSYLTDYTKMTNFISNNTNYTEFDREIKTDLTPDRVAYYSAHTNQKYSGYVTQRYYVLGDGEQIPEYNKKYAKRYIEVDFEFDRDKIKSIGDNSYLVDSSDYGTSHGDHDYIEFSVSGLDLYKDINEDYGFVLNDGRYVHMLDNTDPLGADKWNITRNIYVTNYDVKWKE